MNTLPLPAGPFFCADEGRCLPGLTDLIVQAAAMVQRHEIEEQLLKIKLKQRCFVALAVACPESTVLSPQSNFPANGSDQADFRSPSFRAPLDDFGAPEPGVQVVSPAVTHSPDLICRLPNDFPAATGRTLHSLKVFPMAPECGHSASAKALDNSYPKGRW